MLRIGLELDGYAHHVSGRAFANDRDRQNAILADGWHLLRYTYAHIRDEAPRVVAEIRAAMRDRAGGGAADPARGRAPPHSTPSQAK